MKKYDTKDECSFLSHILRMAKYGMLSGLIEIREKEHRGFRHHYILFDTICVVVAREYSKQKVF